MCFSLKNRYAIDRERKQRLKQIIVNWIVIGLVLIIFAALWIYVGYCVINYNY